MRHAFMRLSLILSLLCASGIASAQSTVDMKGTWTGTSRSIVNGMPAHHPADMPAKSAGEHRLTSIKITLKIDGQDDGRFWGTLVSAAKEDPVIGVIAADGKRVRIVQKGRGILEGILLDNESLEYFYTENKDGSSVAATVLLKRQK